MKPAIATSSAPANGRRAFTLVELLAVLCIVGILAALVLVGVARSRSQSYAATETSNLRAIALAAKVYAVDNKNRFPKPNSSNWDGWAEGLIAAQGLDPALFASPFDDIERTADGPRRSFGINARIALASGLYANVVSPVHAILFAPRATAVAVIGKPGSAELYGSYNFSLFRDDGKVSLAFMDGHVETVPYDPVTMKSGGAWETRYFYGN